MLKTPVWISAPLKAQLSYQYEAGLKAASIDGRLSATLAFYDLTKSNIPTPILGMPGRNDVAGEVRNRGIELDISGALTKHWQLIGSYSYIDSEIIKDRDGMRNQGNRLKNVPRHSGSIWTAYEFENLGLPGLTAGIGGFFASQREGNNANTFQLPGYGRMDASLAYSKQLGSIRLTTQFNVENLLDNRVFRVNRVRQFAQHTTRNGANFPRFDKDGVSSPVVSYKNQEARTLRIWDGNRQQPITWEVFSP